MMKRSIRVWSIFFTTSSLLWGWAAEMKGSQTSVSSRQTSSSNDISGVVGGTNGPEAGVWVIAETADLATAFRKIVVTDDQGRFLVPDLPKAKYKVWVRGYGLADSVPVEVVPGRELKLTASRAPNPRAAAQIYPANYWFSLVRVPPVTDFSSGDIAESIHTAANASAQLVGGIHNQAEWIYSMRGCQHCHQLGDKASREIEANLGTFNSSVAAWDRRLMSGQRGPNMQVVLNQFPRDRVLKMFADWTDRIAAGEVPEAPPRPQGVERNVVLTEWNWASGPDDWIHDALSTDKRNPTVNANGEVYGTAPGTNSVVMLDPNTNEPNEIKVPTREEQKTIAAFSETPPVDFPSPYFGEKLVWANLNTSPHNAMMDEKGRVWVTTTIRGKAAPAFCEEGSGNLYTKNDPLPSNNLQLSVYDPVTKKWTLIDTCFGTHHLQFAHDKDNTLYLSGQIGALGWLNTRVFEETKDEQAAQGWCPAYYDIKGDGKYDPKIDKTVSGFPYGLAVNPADGSVWYAATGLPGKIVRIDRGSNPPATCRTEVYEPPYKNPDAPDKVAFGPHGIDIDTNGIVWAALPGSGQLVSFDRRKCTVRSGPAATGQQCPQAWTPYPLPGPVMKGATAVAEASSADFVYFDWVDQFDILGLGKNVPIATGSNSDSFPVLNPQTGKWVVLRVPYPLGLYARGLDGRIDDAKAGWKGRGLWATYSEVPVWHIEGGKKATSMLLHIQLRPDPLAH